MDSMRDTEIRVLREVIEAVESRLVTLESAGVTVIAPRAHIYAATIQALLASARTTGHYGAGSLVRAPLLDAILPGTDAAPWDAAIYTLLLGSVLVD
ncbi:hypothetical protein LTV02_18920 [Nocardia yamanashiensis]|uniref:hypothetical protein n=1 Tax=Nocardia yamanashiensis TaxID=209247 RepID=UPI000830B92D|nr:hypothetical protein [Nocardia yamanashiensis]UGT45328.1 hypothetical protein LTV02_18920 [Nocardia yamanashiensis]